MPPPHALANEIAAIKIDGSLLQGALQSQLQYCFMTLHSSLKQDTSQDSITSLKNTIDCADALQAKHPFMCVLKIILLQMQIAEMLEHQKEASTNVKEMKGLAKRIADISNDGIADFGRIFDNEIVRDPAKARELRNSYHPTYFMREARAIARKFLRDEINAVEAADLISAIMIRIEDIKKDYPQLRQPPAAGQGEHASLMHRVDQDVIGFVKQAVHANFIDFETPLNKFTNIAYGLSELIGKHIEACEQALQGAGAGGSGSPNVIETMRSGKQLLDMFIRGHIDTSFLAQRIDLTLQGMKAGIDDNADQLIKGLIKKNCDVPLETLLQENPILLIAIYMNELYRLVDLEPQLPPSPGMMQL